MTTGNLENVVRRAVEKSHFDFNAVLCKEAAEAEARSKSADNEISKEFFRGQQVAFTHATILFCQVEY